MKNEPYLNVFILKVILLLKQNMSTKLYNANNSKETEVHADTSSGYDVRRIVSGMGVSSSTLKLILQYCKVSS